MVELERLLLEIFHITDYILLPSFTWYGPIPKLKYTCSHSIFSSISLLFLSHDKINEWIKRRAQASKRSTPYLFYSQINPTLEWMEQDDFLFG